MTDLSGRAKQILYHAVTEYVATGEPVGSRTLSKKLGMRLSPASIRNVLSDLEETGYLHKPHTSAGRIPTDKAFRLFIDALMQIRAIPEEDEVRIRERLSSAENSASLLRETGRLLSELTGTAAVVVAPRTDTLTIKHLRFMRLSEGEILAVLVLTNGSVQNLFFRATVSESDLQRVHNLLDDVTFGRTLGELRELFARRLTGERSADDELHRRAFELGQQALDGVADKGHDIVIEGPDKLLSMPEFRDEAGARRVVSMLDARETIVALLDATLAANTSSVVVGSEAGCLGDGKLSIVGASYGSHGKPSGSVGVIGPTRMDYPKVVPLVAATASAMTLALERKDRKT